MSDVDPNLEALFKSEVIDDDGFSDKLGDKIAQQSRRRTLIRLTFSAILLGTLLGVVIVFDLAALITYSLAMPIFNFGDGWLGKVLLPVNNVGALLFALYKIIQLGSGRQSSPHVRLGFSPY